MNKVATIVPSAHLELTKDDELFMALSYAADDESYRSFFRNRVAEGKYVILDNSAVEMGEPENVETYIRKAIDMNASEIVLPDWFQDVPKTMDSLAEALDAVKRLEYNGSLMAVPQGRSPGEWFECAYHMASIPEVSVLGLSRRYKPMYGHRRLMVTQAKIVRLNTNRLDLRVHLLGCLEGPNRDVDKMLDMPFVRGVDSSLAACFTKAGRVLREYSPRPAPVIDIVNDRYDDDLMSRNIWIWQQMCYGERDAAVEASMSRETAIQA